jgi:hypothetical protein
LWDCVSVNVCTTRLKMIAANTKTAIVEYLADG